MNLDRAAFEFVVEPKLVELDARIGDSGGHSALGLRNLHRLEIWFNRRPVDPSLDKKDLVEIGEIGPLSRGGAWYSSNMGSYELNNVKMVIIFICGDTVI
jgi:hypothetical protein